MAAAQDAWRHALAGITIADLAAAIERRQRRHSDGGRPTLADGRVIPQAVTANRLAHGFGKRSTSGRETILKAP